MEIIINHQRKEIPEHCSVEQLLAILLPDNPKGTAVAVNQTIIPRSAWTTNILKPNDSITLIKATQGG